MARFADEHGPATLVIAGGVAAKRAARASECVELVKHDHVERRGGASLGAFLYVRRAFVERPCALMMQHSFASHAFFLYYYCARASHPHLIAYAFPRSECLFLSFLFGLGEEGAHEALALADELAHHLCSLETKWRVKYQKMGRVTYGDHGWETRLVR